MHAALLILGLAAAPVQVQHQHDATTARDSIIVRPRLTLTPARMPSPADSARGEQLVATARAAVARYQSVARAEEDGYRVFAPMVKEQRVLHYVNRANARHNRTSFDAARPTALLYRRGPDGALALLGVMYTMPATASLDQLDAAVPLSLTSWHQHTNTCRPRRLNRDELESFAAAKAFRHSSREGCEAAGGRFVAEGRNWMVHVNVMARDPEDVWEHRGHSAAPGGRGHMH